MKHELTRAGAGLLKPLQSLAARMVLLRAGTRTSLLLLGGLLILGLSGCAGYKLGPVTGVPPGERSVQVNPFVNQALEPRLSAAVTSSIRETLQQDGTYRLNTSNEGDIIVSGTIMNFERAQLSFQPTDVLTPRDYRLYITAHVTARERTSGKILLDRKVTGQTTLRVGADLTSAERQAIPLAAQDLARNVTSLLVDGPW